VIFLDALEEFRLSAGSTDVWLGVAALAAILLIWNRGRNLESWFLFVGSLASALLIGQLLYYVLPDVRDSHYPWVGRIELVLACASMVTSLLCSLATGWSLVTRIPLRNASRVFTLLIVGYGPVVVLIGGWALLFVVLASIGV
jgi:hypothetical protein